MFTQYARLLKGDSENETEKSDSIFVFVNVLQKKTNPAS